MQHDPPTPRPAYLPEATCKLAPCVGYGGTMIADRIVVIATVACAAFAIGMDYGTSKPVVCPDKAPHEQLVSITINGPVTVCTYSNSYGKGLRRAKS